MNIIGIKKNSGCIFLAKSEKGISINPKSWLTIDSIYKKAAIYIVNFKPEKLDPEIDRLDVRPDKGIVKFSFKEHYWAFQLDATTGNVLKAKRTHADLIEQIHDVLIVDKYLGIKMDGSNYFIRH